MTNDKSKSSENNQEEYIKFNSQRLATHDFKAEEKLKAIDELADLIFEARKNYKEKKMKILYELRRAVEILNNYPGT